MKNDISKCLLLLAISTVLCGAMCGVNPHINADSEVVGDPEPGLRVVVRDAETGEALPGATVTVSNEAIHEVLVKGGRSGYLPRDGDYVGVFQSGVHELTVELAGYATVTKDNIRILQGRWAHQDFMPIDVGVKLTKLPSEVD